MVVGVGNLPACAAVSIPVSADRENCFADAPEDVAETVRLGGQTKLVITGRAENYLRGIHDLADTVERLQAYQEAGADVLFAPGVTDLDELRTLVAAVDRPVSVLPPSDIGTVAARAAFSA